MPSATTISCASPETTLAKGVFSNCRTEMLTDTGTSGKRSLCHSLSCRHTRLSTQSPIFRDEIALLCKIGIKRDGGI